MDIESTTQVMSPSNAATRCCAGLPKHGWLLSLLILSAGCAAPPHRVEFDGAMPIEDCPEEINGLVSVSAQSLPIAVPNALIREAAAHTQGQLARRVVVSVTAAAALRDVKITWSELSLQSFGGTFLGWTALQTPFTEVDVLKSPAAGPLSPAAITESVEAASVKFSPGEIKVIRAARGRADLSGVFALDVLVMPGGIAVDDTVFRTTQLWAEDGAPLPADAVKFELVPAHHPPGYDVVLAGLDLSFIIRRGRGGGEWSCTAEGRVTLVDEEAIRQPLWDIGIASQNGGRTRWLALSDPAVGVVRLIFDSPVAANAFANWVHMRRAKSVGRYSLGVFEPPESDTRRSFAPIESAAMQTFKPLTSDDFDALRIGTLGEH